MRSGKWMFIICGFLFLAGIGHFLLDSTKLSQSQVIARESGGKQNGEASAVPDWIYEDLKTRFPDPAKSMIKKESISFLQVQMRPATMEVQPEPELAAYITLDHLNGVFVLYAKQNGEYQAIYEKKEPVYGLQVVGGGAKQLVLTAGMGGTGIQENKLYIIRHTPMGYKEVWEGIAHYHQAQQTIDVTDGNVQFDGDDRLIYFQLKRTLDSTGAVLMEKSSYQQFTYNDTSMQYVK